MSGRESAFMKWKYTGLALLFVLIMAILLFRVTDEYQVCLLLLTGILLLLRPLPFRAWTKVDVALCLVTLCDLLSPICAVSTVAAMPRAGISLLVLMGYFVSRRLFVSDRALKVVCSSSLLPIGLALVLAICSFFIFRRSVLGVGFEDTYHFRFLFRPLGYITNTWAEVLLFILGWLCLVRRYSGLLVFLTIGAILLSFSRGAYIALAVYVVLWLVSIKPNREKLRVPLLTLFALLVVWISFPVELKTTLEMNRTVSQRQSTSGRIDATRASWEAFRERPLLGYGSGNYTLAIDKGLNQDSTRSYTSMAPNLLVQLLVEKGIVGLMLCLFLLIAIIRLLWKRREERESRVAVCLLSALVVKEMTQASLLGTPFVLFLLYVLLGFLQRGETEMGEQAETVRLPDCLLFGMVFLCYFAYVGFVFRKKQDDQHLREIESAWERGAHGEAIRLMERMGEQTSDLVNRALLYSRVYHETNDTTYLNKAEDALREAHRCQPEDVQVDYLLACLYLDRKEVYKALKIMERLGTKYPRNAFYLFTWSKTLYQREEKEAALSKLTEAIRYKPRLLNVEYMHWLRQFDPEFYQALKLRLSGLGPISNDTPTSYAHYGYITYWLGYRPKAESYLRKAVSELPNLATPWYLLGDMAKSRLLLYGAFQKDLQTQEIPDYTNVSEEQLFEQYYQLKFTQWYGAELLSLK